MWCHKRGEEEAKQQQTDRKWLKKDLCSTPSDWNDDMLAFLQRDITPAHKFDLTGVKCKASDTVIIELCFHLTVSNVLHSWHLLYSPAQARRPVAGSGWTLQAVQWRSSPYRDKCPVNSSWDEKGKARQSSNCWQDEKNSCTSSKYGPGAPNSWCHWEFPSLRMNLLASTNISSGSTLCFLPAW